MREGGRPQGSPLQSLIVGKIPAARPCICGRIHVLPRERSEALMNRRDVLGAAAMAAGGVGLRPLRAEAGEEGSAEMAGLSRYMAEAAARTLPDDVAEHGKHH